MSGWPSLKDFIPEDGDELCESGSFKGMPKGLVYSCLSSIAEAYVEDRWADLEQEKGPDWWKYKEKCDGIFWFI
jgi:hypothetical protein